MSRSAMRKSEYWRPAFVCLCIFGLVSLYYHHKGLTKTKSEPSKALVRHKITLDASLLTSEPLSFDDTLSPTDPKVLKYLRARHLIPPSKEPYKSHMSVNMGVGKETELSVLKALKYKEYGFFIECGANDGKFLSNTIGLESNLNWNGLLIEASPSLFKKLKTMNRKAWLADVCLSGKIEKMEFIKSNLTDHNWRVGNGKIKPGKYKKHRDMHMIGMANNTYTYREQDYTSEGVVECFPLQSILLAINVTTVDFFSLDIEGHEYQVLKGIPFKDMDIKVLLVEHVLAQEGTNAIENLMLENGYKTLFKNGQDFIFKKFDSTVKSNLINV